MRIILSVILCCCTVFFVAGCAADGSVKNPFATSEPVPGENYYYGEFSDIPIPNEMSESKNDTFITFAPSGLKCGVQRFTGRVDLVSLMNTMRKNMANTGWTLRSLLRSKESVLVFEKPDRVAALQITDGMVYTEMRVFVSSRLEGDSASLELMPYTAPPKQSSGQNLTK
ncbi:hypothetical protein LJC59_04175 [Desulfovibrio sp. OttesenSCG-928-A18]|nr:hypothetical protein [Desulfovibrio sp. OttesenSCG-928-A18]